MSRRGSTDQRRAPSEHLGGGGRPLVHLEQATTLRRLRHVLQGPTIALGIILLVISLSARFAGAQQVEQPFPAEEWTIEQLRQSGAADLDDFTRDDKRLRGTFIKRLLTGSIPGLPGRVSLRHAHCATRLEIKKLSIGIEAVFENCRFRRDVELSEVTFDKMLTFEACTFEGTFRIRSCNFRKPVSFGHSVLEGAFDCEDCLGPGFSAGLDLSYISVKGDCTIKKCTVNAEATGQAAFNGLHAFVGGDLDLTGSTFGGGVVLNTAIVTGGVSLQGGTFSGGIDGIELVVGKQLLVVEVAFRSSALVSFNSAKVGGHCMFYADGLKATECDGPLDLLRASIGGNLQLQFLACRYVGRGRAACDVRGVHVTGSVLTKGLQRGVRIQVGGMRYEEIKTNEKPEEWRDLLELLGEAEFSADGYAQAEQYLVRVGRRDLADDVYVSMRRRQVAEVTGRSLAGRGWDWVLDNVAVFGRAPSRQLYCGLALFVFGWLWAFRVQHMVPSDGGNWYDKYEAWWFSLEALLPLVDLNTVRRWRPGDDQAFARAWFRVHRLAGWFLVSVALGSLTGVIR